MFWNLTNFKTLCIDAPYSSNHKHNATDSLGIVCRQVIISNDIDYRSTWSRCLPSFNPCLPTSHCVSVSIVWSPSRHVSAVSWSAASVVHRRLAFTGMWYNRMKTQISSSNKWLNKLSRVFLVYQERVRKGWFPNSCFGSLLPSGHITPKRRHFDVITSKCRFDVLTTLLLRHLFRGYLHDAGRDAMNLQYLWLFF